MSELSAAAILFLLLLLSSVAGWCVQPYLSEHHKSRDTVESIRLVVTMLVTFAALVLGLLVTSVKANFDDHAGDVRRYAITLIQVDDLLRAYGQPAVSLRHMLREYTAAFLASTWPEDRSPPGNYPKQLQPVTEGSFESPELGDLIGTIDETIREFVPPDEFHRRIAAQLSSLMADLLIERWTLIENAQPTISWPFVLLLTMWLIIVFASFGVGTPANGLVYAVILLSALTVASSVFLILDLDTPLTGSLKISSQPVWDALHHMDRQEAGKAPAS